MRTTALQHQDGLQKAGGREEDKNLLEEGQKERNKATVEELGSSQSGYIRQKVLVKQRQRPYAP